MEELCTSKVNQSLQIHSDFCFLAAVALSVLTNLDKQMVGWESGPRTLHQNKYNFHFNSRIFQLYFCRRTKLRFLKTLLSLSFILMGSQYQRHPSCLIKVLVFIITAALCFHNSLLVSCKVSHVYKCC